ncbi:hypothetical protein [Sphingomonas sp. 8AM]|uniref:hypothetical protein n=1 Tax=Sphingomonas sp. 8AM TaxID=2653170 RepID=UPI0012F10FF1|nr:hypothetical protein [Sphingomonas sp. 8AM]VXD00318.1 membrane hypothetical protein [Sphingomonas sp. 8AM]
MTADRVRPDRRWWKPRRRTALIALGAAVATALLAAGVFGPRDASNDAAGQGLAAAFEAAVFAMGTGLIALVALVAWLSQHLRFRTVMLIVVALLAVTIGALFA